MKPTIFAAGACVAALMALPALAADHEAGVGDGGEGEAADDAPCGAGGRRPGSLLPPGRNKGGPARTSKRHRYGVWSPEWNIWLPALPNTGRLFNRRRPDHRSVFWDPSRIRAACLRVCMRNNVTLYVGPDM